MAFFEASPCGLEHKLITFAGLISFIMHAGIFFTPFAVFFVDWVVVEFSAETILEIFR